MAATLDPTLVTLAQRISAGLMRELGTGIDARRMVAQPVYARDVLLVCEAMKGSELEALGQQFQALQRGEESIPTTTRPGSLWPESRSGAPSLSPRSWFKSGSRPRK